LDGVKVCGYIDSSVTNPFIGTIVGTVDVFIPGILDGDVYLKADTGHPTITWEGMTEINAFDNKVYVYADAAWRQIATW
jgi:hypothetical protein